MDKSLTYNVGDIVLLKEENEIAVIVQIGKSEIFVQFAKIKFADGRTKHLTITRLAIARARYLEASGEIEG